MSQYERMISADSHIFEETDMWSKPLGARFGDEVPHVMTEYNGKKGNFFYTGAQVLTIGGIDAEHKKTGLHMAGYDPAKRIEFQRQSNVLAEVLYPSYGLIVMQSRHFEALKAVAEVYNDWLDNFISHDRKRLLGVGMIPMVGDVAWAVKELERVAKMGFVSVCVNCVNKEGTKPYRHPEYDRFWARAAELGITLTLHSITGRVKDPLHPHNPEELAEAPGIALDIYAEVQKPLANDFIFGGIFDRHPKLKVIVSEFEISWLPNYAWRLDMIQTGFASRITMPKLQLGAASEYLKQRVWFGWIDDGRGKLAVDEVGASRMMWGSDFPHVRSVGVDTQSTVGRMLKELPQADQELIVGGVAADLFGIDAAALAWPKRQAAE